MYSNNSRLGEHMKFKYLVILISVLSLVLLYGVSLFSQPEHVPLSMLPNYDGQQVIVQGVVTAYRTTEFGTQLITLQENNDEYASAILYIDGAISVEFGDTVQAIGQVQRYKDQWEVTVNNPRLVTILQKWTNISFPLWQLAEHPMRYLNTNINVTGIITKKNLSTVVLSDPSHTYSLEISYDSSDISLFSEGDTVAVQGRFLYEPHCLHFLLQLSEKSHGIIQIEGDRYG